MLNRTVFRAILIGVLALSSVTITACQTTRKAQPEMLTGDSEPAHGRHETGVDSHTAD